MAEKIRAPHLPTASAPSQQPGSASPSQVDAIQHGIAKTQQLPVLHGHIPSHPDVALHARPASSSVTGVFMTTSCSLRVRVLRVFRCVTRGETYYFCPHDLFSPEILLFIMELQNTRFF